MGDKTVVDWINTSDPGQQRAIVDDIASRINRALITIPQLFRDLQPFLTSEDVPLPDIAHALALFAEILGRLETPLNRIDVHGFTEYFCQRLENRDNLGSFRAGIKECAQILKGLATMEQQRFPANDAKLVAQSIFAFTKGGTLRDQKAATRSTLLELASTLIQLYKHSLITSLGREELVRGITSMAEFEKDPTCLNVLFQIYERLSRDWDLSEESLNLIWDSFIRYYPIKLGGRGTSVPSPDELKQLLLRCFTSNNSYAKHAFPRLIELLDTSQDLSANVKNDVFITMAACVSGYSTLVVLEWASKVWDSLKFEIWNGENEEFIRGALNVIHELAKALSQPVLDWNDTEDPSAKVLLEILRECCSRLLDSRQRYMPGTGSIINAVASASPYSFLWTARKLLPIVFTLWQETSSKSDKNALMGVVNSLLQARLAVEQELDNKLRGEVDIMSEDHTVPLPSSASISKDRLASSLDEFQRNLIDNIYFSAMTEALENLEDNVQFRVTTIQGLVLLMSIRNLLSDMEKGIVIEFLNSILLQADQQDTLNEAAISALQNLSSSDPANFQKITLTNLMSRLPAAISADTKQTQSEIDRVIYLLDSLTQIACTTTCNLATNNSDTEIDPKDYIFVSYQKALISKLTDILKHAEQLVYANVILGAILQGLVSYDGVLNTGSNATTSHYSSSRKSRYHPYGWIQLSLCQNVVAIKHLETHGQTVAASPYIGLKVTLGNEKATDKFISLLGDIATFVLRSKQTTSENNFLNSDGESSRTSPSQIWSLFAKDAPDSIAVTQQDLIGAPADKCLANVLSMSLVAGLRREEKSRLRLEVGNVALAMIRNASSTATKCSSFARVSMLHFVQLLVTKFGALEEKIGDHNLVQVMVDLVESVGRNSDELEAERHYQALSYFTAAALAYGHKSSELLIRLMIEGLKHPKLGRKVARSFRVLLAPSKIMSKENFCILRPLRQGRLFQFGTEEIQKLWRQFSFAQRENPNATDIKTNCLIALAATLMYMDTSTYLERINEVLPLVLEGTNIRNEDFTKLSCITIVRTLVPVCPGVIESHLDSVINRMTDRTHNTNSSPSDASAGCRIAALDVLGLLPKHIDNAALLKRKNKVVNELDIALNDASMEVRMSAQKCKLVYFNLGE